MLRENFGRSLASRISKAVSIIDFHPAPCPLASLASFRVLTLEVFSGAEWPYSR